MPRRRLRLNCSSDSEEEPNQQPTVTHPHVTQSPPNPNPGHPDPLPISSDDDYFTPPSPTVSTGSPIGESLLRLGLSLKRDWLDSCVQGLEHSVSGFSHLDVLAKAKHCFQQSLFSDMNYSGAGVLPENVNSMHLVELKGPFVLQVDELVNISCPLRGRYQDSPSSIKRCLKLSMTDGVQRVFGIEYRPIKDLQVLAPSGLKVAICNVHIRHGLLMLVPETLEVLGGMVQELDAARRRIVDEVNKPPRGKRTRTGVVPSLSTRATLAAWQSNGVHVTGHVNSSTSQNVTPFQANERDATFVAFRSNTSQRTTEESTVHVNGENAVANSSNIVMGAEEMHIDPIPSGRENPISNSNSNAVLDVEDINMDDVVEHPLILSGDREIPFTYLASLSAKWAATKGKGLFVQGKIKCFLTGVKKFQYKEREKYELLVYVDDGSLICEILVDHNVVQKGIGHSPKEVTAALSSLDRKKVGDMKEIFRQFQLFLANFEGTMLVEINETSPHPIAREMTEGCPPSDAWLLFRRLKASPTAHASTPPRPPIVPIDISP
ncbi:hypothetical protein JRO89_XS01G0397700 [Xanthoceras sorbifolium]|uniref:RecQ-mediated genome instability protein 1 n=1 Tax=Xanthoceras sorbifolium TaxID=99658 RepID=A0ABQ8IPD3_9ROSI|nr:hypothetical protein JRO89_XS01G0397700 [Xanthoceras sorbifolium]